MFLLGIDAVKYNASVFTQPAKLNQISKANTKAPQDNTLLNSSNATDSNSSQRNASSNKTKPLLPPGFPEPLPPFNDNKQAQSLITQGDNIIAEMDALISGIDISALKLTQAQQDELTAKTQKNQIKIDELQTKLEAIKNELLQ